MTGEIQEAQDLMTCSTGFSKKRYLLSLESWSQQEYCFCLPCSQPSSPPFNADAFLCPIIQHVHFFFGLPYNKLLSINALQVYTYSSTSWQQATLGQEFYFDLTYNRSSRSIGVYNQEVSNARCYSYILSIAAGQEYSKVLSDTLCLKLTRVHTYLHNRRILATVYHVLSKFLIVLLKIIWACKNNFPKHYLYV